MLRRASLILGTALLLATALLAQAQTQRGQQRGQRPGGQGRPGGFGTGVTTLLAMPEVQKELGVTDQQKGLIDDMLKDLRGAGGRAGGTSRQDFQNLSQEERQKRIEELRKQGEERAKKAEDAAKLVLEPKQFERLIQLRLQREGTAALQRSDVSEKLGLTQDQKDKIRKIRDEARGNRGTPGNRNASPEDRQKAAAEARDRREKANAAILGVLTAKQKETWEQLQGKKFDFPQPQARRPRSA